MTSPVAAVGRRQPASWATYFRFEVLRTLRARRFFVFSLVFPLVLYVLIAGSNRKAHVLGIPFPVYYLAGMAAWGTMQAVVAGGARISLERAVGWTRQIRVTPLPPRVYFTAKILTGYLMGLLSLVILYIAGVSLGVRLSGKGWLLMTGLVLVGLVPFAVFGIVLGHLLSPDSLGPALGGSVTLFALLGGAWGPLAHTGFLHKLVELLPSYWLVQAGEAGLTARNWPAEGWLVTLVWTVALLRIAVRVYRRDTLRA
jgi:ABC-2 type transport system permease protein